MSKKCADCGKGIDKRAVRCTGCASRARWAEPEFRRKMSEIRKTLWSDSGYRQKVSEARKAMWSDAAFRRKRAKSQGAALANPEYRQGQARASRARWADPEFRRKMLEIRRSERFRQNQSEVARAQWANPGYLQKMAMARTEEYHQNMSEVRRVAWVEGVYDGCFRSPTSIEIEVAGVLDACGIEHRSQYRPDGYSRIYDEFVAPDILIEVQGDYWHGPERPEVQERDVEKAVWAEGNGYHLVVMWEHEIRELGAWPLVRNRVLPLLYNLWDDKGM
jgi:hypothetical protein